MEFLAEFLVPVALWVLEIAGELLLQVFGQAIVEMLAHLFRPLQTRTESLRPWFVTLAWGLVGGFVGALSLALFPRHFVHTPELRVLNLFLTPLAAGYAMAALGRWRARHGQAPLRLDSFVCGFTFAIAMGLVRYRFAA
jgi:hypothetical protein